MAVDTLARILAMKALEGGGGSGGGGGDDPDTPTTGQYVQVTGFGSNLHITQENYDLLIQSPTNGVTWGSKYYELGMISASDDSRVYYTVLNMDSGTSLEFMLINTDLTVARSVVVVSSDTYTLITSPVTDDVYTVLKNNRHAQIQYEQGYYEKTAYGSAWQSTLYFQGGVIDSNSKEWIPQTLIISGTTKEVTVVPNTSGKIEFVGGMLPDSFEIGKEITVPRSWLVPISGNRSNIYKGELVLSKYNYLLIADSTQEVRPAIGTQVTLRMLKSFVPNTKEIQIPISSVTQDATTGLWSLKFTDADIEPNVYVRIYPADEVTSRILTDSLVSTVNGYYIATPAASETPALYGVEMALTKQPYSTLSFYYELRGVTPNGN